MDIKIEKRKVTIDANEFKKEIIALLTRYKKAFPNRNAVKYNEFKSHFKLKISEFEFIEICRILEIILYGDSYVDIRNIEEHSKEEDLILFDKLALGARFKYKGDNTVWTKISSGGCGLIARYEKDMMKDSWVGQSFCSGKEDDNEDLMVIFVE